MKSYEYKFVELPAPGGFRLVVEDPFEKCKEIIVSEARNGWRLKQVVTPFNTKVGIYGAAGYQIIFEREIEAES